MELRIIYFLGTIVVMLHISEARPYLIDTPEADSEQDEIMAVDERNKYMNTNDLSAFQDPDLYSMEEIAEEDKIKQKRLVPKSETSQYERVERQRKIRALCVVPSGPTLIIIPCWKRG